MSFHDEYDFSVLVNEKEHWVIDELERQMESAPEVCRCNDCVLDMVTFALNHSRPIYRATLLGAIFAKVEDEATRIEIQEDVKLAIQKVSSNPSHPPRK